MKLKLAVIPSLTLFAFVGASAQTPTLSCRPLDSPNNYVAPDEKIIGNQACKIVAVPISQKPMGTQTSAPGLVMTTESVPPTQTERTTPVATSKNEMPTAAVEPQLASPPEVATPCLIVASAEGHRFRDSTIAGALTGGIGFAAGAFAGGAKYAYRDSYDLPPSDVREKYKGKQLQKIQASGVHVIVVNAKDKTGSEIEDARKSCRER